MEVFSPSGLVYAVIHSVVGDVVALDYMQELK